MAYYNQYYSNLLAREVFQPEDHQNEPHQPNALRQDICDVEDEDDGQSWYEEETSFHFNEEPAQQNNDEDNEDDNEEYYQDAQDLNEAEDS